MKLFFFLLSASIIDDILANGESWDCPHTGYSEAVDECKIPLYGSQCSHVYSSSIIHW